MVYVIKNNLDDTFKIGCSTKPNRRLNEIRRQFPDVKLVICIEGSFELERAIHWNFEAKRVFGEWFNLTYDDIDLIERVSPIDFIKQKQLHSN